MVERYGMRKENQYERVESPGQNRTVEQPLDAVRVRYGKSEALESCVFFSSFFCE